ncbi:MAG: glycosyltransferase family 39 protein [Planctomycetaceae bacterium]
MRSRRLPIVLLLIAQAVLLGWAAVLHSPIFDETPHLAAGVAKWRFGRFDLYLVNPPLPEMLAALPVLADGCQADWSRFSDRPLSRAEFAVGRDFAAANGSRTLRLVILARLALIPLLLVGGWVCWRWGSDLFGPRAGTAAAALWVFSPTVLGNGALVTADAAAASTGVLAGWLFWRWLREPSSTSTFAAGVGLGLALLTKFTWLILVPLWPLLWIAFRLPERQMLAAKEWGRQAGQLAVVMLLALYLIHAGYGFEKPFRPLGEFEFVSRNLSGDSADAPPRHGVTGNRFRGTWLESVPVPVPANYLVGIDVQKVDFEQSRSVYLDGEQYSGGVWYWYLYALPVKEPVALWLLLGVTVVVAPLPRGRDLLVLLAPAAGVIVLVSWNHSLCHYRYVLPALPFLFIAAGGAAAAISRQRRIVTAIVAASLLWYAGSSLAVAPHWLSYFNEVAGGPKNGWRHLSGSALDWGQGLIDLRHWLDEHPEAKPLRLAYTGNFDPHLAGIEFDLPPREPQPGWYAISATFLADGTRLVGVDGVPQSVPEGSYAWFRNLEPVYRAADVLYVYHVSTEDAERVRRMIAKTE